MREQKFFNNQHISRIICNHEQERQTRVEIWKVLDIENKSQETQTPVGKLMLSKHTAGGNQVAINDQSEQRVARWQMCHALKEFATIICLLHVQQK